MSERVLSNTGGFEKPCWSETSEMTPSDWLRITVAGEQYEGRLRGVRLDPVLNDPEIELATSNYESVYISLGLIEKIETDEVRAILAG